MRVKNGKRMASCPIRCLFPAPFPPYDTNTDRAIYNVDPSGFKLKRRIPIELLGGIR
jgi:hypothetical protein